MVAKAKISAERGDRFVDWAFKLTSDVRQETGLSEKKSAEVVSVIIERIQQEYGGGRPYINVRPKSASILKRWAQGWTVSKIAADVECSECWVRKVVSSIPTPKLR